MSSTNLSRVEAQARAALLDVSNYEIVLDLTGSEESFASTTTVRFTAREAGSTFIDLRAEKVVGVLLDGEDITDQAVSLTASGYDEDKGLALQNLTPGEHVLEVSALINYSHTGAGLHRFTDPADGRPYLYTQFEPADAKRVFACFDQPDLKATYDITVTTPAEWRVISNAEQKVSRAGDKAVHSSRIDYPLSTYLVAVCAGPYAEFRDSWSGELTHHAETPADEPTSLTVPLGIYARQSLAKHVDADRLFKETKEGFDYYHRHFGVAYPFNKYDQIFCPEYNMGAMENAGCVTIRDEYIFSSQATHYSYERRSETILHELAHMWFGDLVTMQWWDDLWLNESFATWSAAISQAEETDYDTSWVTFANVEKAWAYDQDQLPSTHPIFSGAGDVEEVEQNFDGITYAKGASVLKQLQAYVGRDAFFAGVRRHFALHRWGNATFDDLLESLTEASGRDLRTWADSWLKTTGVNRIFPAFEITDGHYSSFAVRQEGAQPGAGELRPHRLAVGLYSLADGTVTRTKRVELDVTTAEVPVPELVGQPAADLVLVNDDDLTYCLMQLDDASAAFVVDHIDAITDPMARTLCWSAAWQMTREGTLRARDFVSLVARGAHAETEKAVLERVLGQALTALEAYADPTWARETGRDLLANALLDGARGDDAESALIFARVLAQAPLNDAAADFFREVLAENITNLTVDADLKWWALTALIAHGDIAEPEAEVARLAAEDRSATGEHAAIRARAAINTDENKAAVYARLTDVDSTESNLTLRHLGQGLRYTGATAHLRAFDRTFFEVAEKLWAAWDSEMAIRTLPVVYPSWDVSEDTIAATEAFLTKDLPAGLTRVVSEEKSRLERKLRLRAADGLPQ